jgi:hypothetical protein
MELDQLTVADLEDSLVRAEKQLERALQRRDALREAVDAVRKASAYLGAPSAGERAEARRVVLDEGRDPSHLSAMPGAGLRRSHEGHREP